MIRNPYRPDYAVPPGWVLEERLQAQGISQAEFARRCGRSAKLISEIVSGAAPIEAQTALQFEKALGVDACIWLGMESDYRLHQEREREAQKASALADWVKKFPVSELVKRGIIEKPSSNADEVGAVLGFFGVASADAWQDKHDRTRVAYRHSSSFASDEFKLATWLRLGEIEAAKIECADYSAAKFKRALRRIRSLTTEFSKENMEETHRLCRDSGVALAIIKPLPGTALSGASQWLTRRKAVIQLSARHMSDDHLWFSLFHEAAHILMHPKRDIFVHAGKGDDDDSAEIKANKWAADFLIAPRHWDTFVQRRRFTKVAVQRFADEREISPGIVVGRLQHEKHIPWDRLNSLKKRLKWMD